jgi:TolA-binding protein
VKQFVCLAGVFLVAGCVTTRAEGDALRADMNQLKNDMAELQRRASDEKTKDAERLDKMIERVNQLDQTLTLLRQADADTGVQLDKVVGEVQALRGEIEQARHELGETAQTVKSILERPPVEIQREQKAAPVEDKKQVAGQDVPSDPKAHYDFAKKLFDEKKYEESIEAFDLFLARHGNTAKDLADNAAFWKAEGTFSQASALTDVKAKEKAYKQAILAYQRVLEDPKSEKADSALYKIGLSFEQLKFNDEARVFYEELIAKHPKSALVADAKKRLKALPTPKKKKK